MSEPTVDPRAVTPVFGWHVPVLGDVPNVPADISALATGIETTLAAPVTRGFVTYPTVSHPSGISTLVGGTFTGTADITYASGTGIFTINRAGVYLIQVMSGTVSTTVAARPGMVINPGAIAIEGPFAAAGAYGNQHETTAIRALTAGATVFGRVNNLSGVADVFAAFAIAYLGRS